MMQPGVRAHYPVEIYYTDTDTNGVTLHAPTKRIRHRGDTLGGVVLTLRLSSPLPDVIRVRVSHNEGVQERGPNFPIFAHDAPVTVDDTDEAVTLTSGSLSVRVARTGEWDMAFMAHGKTVTRSGSKALGYVETDQSGAFPGAKLETPRRARPRARRHARARRERRLPGGRRGLHGQAPRHLHRPLMRDVP